MAETPKRDQVFDYLRAENARLHDAVAQQKREMAEMQQRFSALEAAYAKAQRTLADLVSAIAEGEGGYAGVRTKAANGE